MNAWALQRRRRLRGWSFVVLALTALALAPRVLIPQGYMPSGGGFALVVCPDGLSPAAAAVFTRAPAITAPEAHSHHHLPADASPQPAHVDHGAHDAHRRAALTDGQCAFAAAAFLGPVHHLDVVVEPGPAPALPADRAVVAPILTLAHRPQQARAPPLRS